MGWREPKNHEELVLQQHSQIRKPKMKDFHKEELRRIEPQFPMFKSSLPEWTLLGLGANSLAQIQLKIQIS